MIDIKTKGVRDGDHWIISGEKCWITGGHYSDFLICTTRTSEKGLSHFIVDREEHGYELRNIEKIALNSQSTAQISSSPKRACPTPICAVRRASASKIPSRSSKWPARMSACCRSG